MTQRDVSYSLVRDRLRPTPRAYIDELVAAGDQLSLLLLAAGDCERPDYYYQIERARRRWGQATLLVDPEGDR